MKDLKYNLAVPRLREGWSGCLSSCGDAGAGKRAARA